LGKLHPVGLPVASARDGREFRANIGGRVIGTAAAWFTIHFSESNPPNAAKIAVVGAIVAGTYALIGAILTHWLPEPKHEDETDEVSGRGCRGQTARLSESSRS
jgi:hypothetical protein